MKNLLYYQEDNSATYVYLDGGLRHIPNQETLDAIFTPEVINGPRIEFPNAQDAPYPIFNNWPLKAGARLVSTEDPSDGILLEDTYPWDQNVTVLRHVINPQQMTDLGFDWNKVEEYSDKPIFGVPLSTNSDLNINAIQHLKGYYTIYGYFFFGGVVLNPFYEYLLQLFPGHGGSGSNKNRKFRAELKSLIKYWQTIVDSLPNS
ncbi:hypothetical protein [Aquimarina algiphila]|uniref:hypothetical protein n=1 Tax=Aquimarina algiphila TaxID=2047982 RepID=UPI00232E6848|nr:hypothetical protein [Aquimarina algiphila]